MPRMPRNIFGDKVRPPAPRSDVPTPLFDGREVVEALTTE